jgi:hypothetical protein
MFSAERVLVVTSKSVRFSLVTMQEPTGQKVLERDSKTARSRATATDYTILTSEYRLHLFVRAQLFQIVQ